MECIEKVCPRCWVRKDARAYGFHPRSHDRLQSHCLDCQSQMASMRAEQRRVAAVWVDGPDSEAAQASRERHIHHSTPTTGCEGQSVVVPSHYIWADQWPEGLRPRFQDFTDKATTTTEEPSAVETDHVHEFVADLARQQCRGWAEGAEAGFDCAETSACITKWCPPCHARSLTREDSAPDPAVRRVVAWVPAGDPALELLESRDDAYDREACNRIEAALAGRGLTYWDWRETAGEPHAMAVQRRWARILRSHDEKAGHR